jgi:1,2-diacylglycerol 3-beta-galactosyltransferase
MNKTNSQRQKIVFLFSDTGGGHRSAAEAIIEALELEFAGCFDLEMVDIFKEYGPVPFNRMPDLYPHMVRLPRAWGLGYKLSNGHPQARAITASAWPVVRRAMRKLIRDHPANLIVSVHPLAAAPVLKALGRERVPFINVVTDLVTTHALWYHRQVDVCIVPTRAAYKRAMQCGLRPEQVQIVGLPVADRFCQPAADRQELRQRLGWPQDRKMALLVGGGEGMGPLEQNAHAIAEAGLPVGLVIIAGRNQALKARLEAYSWPIPTRIYGFVREMPDFMRASDFLVSKAGPGTISEALIAGLPVILYSRLPGQEDGNVTFVVSEGAGVWAPRPEQVVHALGQWLNDPEKYKAALSACQRLARPQAAREIARILAKWVGAPVIL